MYCKRKGLRIYAFGLYASYNYTERTESNESLLFQGSKKTQKVSKYSFVFKQSYHVGKRLKKTANY